MWQDATQWRSSTPEASAGANRCERQHRRRRQRNLSWSLGKFEPCLVCFHEFLPASLSPSCCVSTSFCGCVKRLQGSASPQQASAMTGRFSPPIAVAGVGVARGRPNRRQARRSTPHQKVGVLLWQPCFGTLLAPAGNARRRSTRTRFIPTLPTWRPTGGAASSDHCCSSQQPHGTRNAWRSSLIDART